MMKSKVERNGTLLFNGQFLVGKNEKFLKLDGGGPFTLFLEIIFRANLTFSQTNSK